jgi:hypothetical protein
MAKCFPVPEDRSINSPGLLLNLSDLDEIYQTDDSYKAFVHEYRQRNDISEGNPCSATEMALAYAHGLNWSMQESLVFGKQLLLIAKFNQHALVKNSHQPACVVVRNNPNAGKEYCPLPLEVIPNFMGINLSNVRDISWTKRQDGQLVDLTINFIPEIK